MAHAAGDAHEFVIYGAHYRVTFPILDADGDLVTGATGADTEASQDGGTFTDTSNEFTELATSSGMYYIDLIGTETDCKQLGVICKTTSSGAKTTPIVLYPNRLPILESGVAEGGAASTITFAVASASAVDDFYNGCYVFISDNDAAGSQYQVRKIFDYVGSTRVATIDSAWGTNPSSSSNYDVLVPPGMAVVQWAGGKIADPTTAGVPEVDVTRYTGVAAPALVSSRYDASVGAMAANVLTATAINADAITAAKVADGAIDAATFAAGAVNAAALATDAVEKILKSVSGTTDSGSATTIVDTERTESPSQYWVGCLVVPTSGANAGIPRRVTDFNAATDTITVGDPWPTTMSAGETYIILRTSFGNVRVDQILGGAIDSGTFAANAINAAALASDAVTEIWSKAMTELSSVPGVTGTVLEALQWIFLLARNKITQTSTTQLLRNDADGATIGTSTVSDDGTTFIRGEFS